MAYYKITEDGYSVGSKPRDGFTEYDTDNVPAELQVLFDAENLTKLIQDGEALVKSIINGHIANYNKVNDVNFESVENCFTYSFDLEYEHQSFCNKICAYKIALWRTARANQVIAITEKWSVEKFIDVLPKFGVE